MFRFYKKSSGAKQQVRRAQLSVEKLEKRTVLDGTVTFGGGTITFYCSENADQAEVSIDPGTSVSYFDDKVVAKLNHGTHWDTYFYDRYVWNGRSYVQNVKLVIVHAKGGDDYFRNYTNIPTYGYMGEGSDHFIGGSGNDYAVGESDGDNAYGNDTLEGGSGHDELIGAEGNDVLYGGGGNDKLFGDEGNDTLDGLSGNDSCYGGTGNDLIKGGSGNDKLYGQAGTDQLLGQSGLDRLDGGLDDVVDTLTGGTEADEFIEHIGLQVDTFADFNAAQGDFVTQL